MIDEGYIKFDIDWTSGPSPDAPEIDELIAWRDRLFDVGLVGCYEDIGIGYGNLSVRIGDSQAFLISGTQTGHIPRTAPEHYAVVSHFDVAANRGHQNGQNAEPEGQQQPARFASRQVADG